MRLLREERGSVLVEVALALPVLAAIFVGAVDYGLLLQQKMRVQAAAAAAAAYVTTPGHNNDLAGAQQVATQAISDMSGVQVNAQRYWSCTPGGSQVSSSSTCNSSHTPMQWVQVDVYATGIPLMSFPGLPSNGVIHAVAMERVQWIP